MHEIWMRSPKSLVYVYLICDCPCTYENGRPNFESMGITLYSQLASDVLASPRSFEDLAAIHSNPRLAAQFWSFLSMEK